MPVCPRCGWRSVYEAYFMSRSDAWCWNCGLLFNIRTGKIYGENKRTGRPDDYGKNKEIVLRGGGGPVWTAEGVGPVRRILSERKTILLDQPLIRKMGLRPFSGALMYDSELESLKEAKGREWTARGYSPKLQNMAFELADDWADKMSDWMLRVLDEPELKRKAYASLYQEALETVADRWIVAMGI